MQHCVNLFTRHAVTVHDLLDQRTRFKVLKNNGYRQPGAFEHPSAAEICIGEVKELDALQEAVSRRFGFSIRTITLRNGIPMEGIQGSKWSSGI